MNIGITYPIFDTELPVGCRPLYSSGRGNRLARGRTPAGSFRLDLSKPTYQVKVDSDRGKIPAMTQPRQLGAAHDYGQPRNDKPLLYGTIHRSMVAGRKC